MNTRPLLFALKSDISSYFLLFIMPRVMAKHNVKSYVLTSGVYTQIKPVNVTHIDQSVSSICVKTGLSCLKYVSTYRKLKCQDSQNSVHIAYITEHSMKGCSFFLQYMKMKYKSLVSFISI